MSLIFGIGLHKTGTCTLNTCFRELGYKSLHDAFVVPQFLKYDRQLNRPILTGLVSSGFNAFSDCPFTYLYRELDQNYPGSRFIVTYRNFEDWFRSRLWHPAPTIRWKLSRERSLQEYESHHAEVREYFGARDVLWWNICDQPDWTVICDFLQKPVPTRKFPWSYKSPTYSFHHNAFADQIEAWTAEYWDSAIPTRKQEIHFHAEDIPKIVWVLINVCSHPESKLICHFRPSSDLENNLVASRRFEKVVFAGK